MRPSAPSTRVYRHLLRLYPAGFRAVYGAELVAAFRCQRREPRYERPVFGHLLFWADILVDLGASATRQRLPEHRPKPSVPRRKESFMGTLTQEFTYALRAMRRNRGVTVAALLTLAIGIGANTAMFSLVDGVLMRPFPYPDPERLAFVWDSNPERGWYTFTVSPANFLDYREQTEAFESMTAYDAGTTTMSGVDEPERLRSVNVASEFFQTFGIAPQIGRAFAPEDNEPGNTNVAILSDRLWARRFESDPGVLGETVILDGFPVTIVGIFTDRTDAPSYADLWMPMEFSEDSLGSRGAHYLVVVGRMKEGIGLPRAAEDLQQIAARLEEAYPDTNTGWTVSVHSLHEDRVGDSRRPLMVLTGAVTLLLLIACANIANLLLARATQRQREVALRVALGAGRGRVFGQVLSESVILGLIGGGLGVIVAVGVMRAVSTLAPDSLPRLDQVGVDLRVLGFTALLSIGTGLLFGLVPALQSARANVNDALKERIGSGGSGAGGVRNSLVIAEVALALVVVIAAGLLMRTLWQLQAIDPGFEVEGRAAARIGLPRSYAEPAEQVDFFEELLANIEGLPGVTAVGATSILPMGGDFLIGFDVESRPAPAGEGPSANLRLVSPGLFEALGVPLLKGRVLSEADRDDSQPVVIVNQRFAEIYFPDSEPIGKRLDIGYRNNRDEPRVREIVGVVGNTRVFDLGSEPVPMYYLSYKQVTDSAMDIVVRTEGSSAEIVGALQREVRALDDDVPIFNVETLQQRVLDSAAPEQFRALLLGSFAGVALLLASIGIYGVMAYSVAQRTRELGIRMALGAARADLLGLVLKRGLLLTGAGIAIGFVGAVEASRLLGTLLFGVTPTDPLTYGIVAGFLLAVSMLACYLPARRATRVDPTVAMRAE